MVFCSIYGSEFLLYSLYDILVFHCRLLEWCDIFCHIMARISSVSCNHFTIKRLFVVTIVMVCHELCAFQTEAHRTALGLNIIRVVRSAISQ